MDYYDTEDNENLEITLLLNAINAKYGYDFRSYARASIKRRIKHRMSVSGINRITGVIEKVIYDRGFFMELLGDFPISTTEMFRDPTFFKALRGTVIPALRQLPFIKIWVAGCSTGEEVYSLAIILREEGINAKSMIYATDYSEKSLAAAKEGVFSLKSTKKYAANYLSAGGLQSFSDYFTARDDSAAIDPSLRPNIVFSIHNLATDGVFGEMDAVICRNVLIYFNRELQDKVFGLSTGSLDSGGYLCLGSKETIRLSTFSDNYDEVMKDEKMYKRNATPLSHAHKSGGNAVVAPGFVTRGGELIRDVKAKLEELNALLRSVDQQQPGGSAMKYKAVVIGTSAGGIEALITLCGQLPVDFPLPVLTVLHLHRNVNNDLITLLNRGIHIKARFAEDKERARAGCLYIAPPDYHMLAESDGTLSLSVDEPVHYSRPSIDVLFESAADAYGSHLIGVILTGANSDGSAGLKRIKSRGGTAIVENPHSARYPDMPLAALRETGVDYILNLDEIGHRIIGLLRHE